MKHYLNACSQIYRHVARFFPHQFRVVCGDGLERLGMDLLPLIYKEMGVAGVASCFADLVFRLPVEYMSLLTNKFKELNMSEDLFEGTWRANTDESQFDP